MKGVLHLMLRRMGWSHGALGDEFNLGLIHQIHPVESSLIRRRSGLGNKHYAQVHKAIHRTRPKLEAPMARDVGTEGTDHDRPKFHTKLRSNRGLQVRTLITSGVYVEHVPRSSY